MTTTALPLDVIETNRMNQTNQQAKQLSELVSLELERRLVEDFENAPPLQIAPECLKANKDAALARIRQFLRDKESRGTPQLSPIEGMRLWVERGLHWLAQSLTGIDIAQGALVPTTLLGTIGTEQPDPIQTLRESGVSVVAQSIRRDGDGLAVTLRWLAPLPADPPEVEVERDGEALGKVWAWTNWVNSPDRGQVLRIGIDLDPNAGPDDQPLLELAWDVEQGRLWCRVVALR
jgi:hypothetical protein